MRTTWHRRGRTRSGFTILEMMVSLAIFSVVGLSLAIVLDAGSHSQSVVIRTAAQDRAMRASTLSLVDELRESSDANITVTTLSDGNHQVRFMVPIDVGGVASWGVFDRSLGNDAASQNRAGWSIRYTVRSVVAPNGTVNRELVRQILDDAQAVRAESVVAEGLHSGSEVPPGFRMVNTGAVWQITLSTTGHVEGNAGMREVFHVQTRN